MFQLVCDPSGVVVDTALKELLPAVIKWGNRLEHILRVLLSHILSSAQVWLFLAAIFFLMFFCCFWYISQFFSLLFSALSSSLGG
jgi:hypothetical protein